MQLGVVGAGVVGLWTALQASEAGWRVTVYEEASRPGRGASGHNAGVIHVVQPPFGSLKSRLALEGSRVYGSWAEKLGFRMVRTRLLLASTSRLAPALSRLVAAYLKSRGYEAKPLPPEQVREEECPALSRRVRGLVAVEGYGIVDPREVLESLVDALVERGVELRWECRVERAVGGKEQVHVETACGVGEAFEGLVVAAGAGSRSIALASGAWAPRQVYARGVMARVSLGGECQSILAWLPTRSPRRTKGGGIIPQITGGHLLGPSFQETPDPWDTHASREEAWGLVERFSPLLEGEPILESWTAGTRVVNTPRDDFLLHRWGRMVFLYGIDSPGLTAAPLLARLALERLAHRA